MSKLVFDLIQSAQINEAEYKILLVKGSRIKRRRSNQPKALNFEYADMQRKYFKVAKKKYVKKSLYN